MKTPSTIIARIEEVKDADFFGFETEDLVGALPFTHAKPFLKEGVKESDWHPTETDEDVITKICKYMPFAITKATDHRSISAERSTEHFHTWMWLLDRDNEVDWDAYTNYGAPILKQVMEIFDIVAPTHLAFDRMAQGLSCKVGCRDGCGQ